MLLGDQFSLRVNVLEELELLGEGLERSLQLVDLELLLLLLLVGSIASESLLHELVGDVFDRLEVLKFSFVTFEALFPGQGTVSRSLAPSVVAVLGHSP